jgi:serine protease
MLVRGTILALLLASGFFRLASAQQLVPPYIGRRPAPVTLPMIRMGMPVAPTKIMVETPLVTGRMIVKLNQNSTAALIQQVSRVLGVTVVGKLKPGPYLLVKPIARKGFVALAEVNLPIEYIEPEVRMALLPIVQRYRLPEKLPLPLSKALDARETPNDPYLRFQWGFADGLYGVGLPTVRALTQGTGIICAILDTGVRQTSTDLTGTKFMSGLNVIANNTNTNDDNGHGTHVCGTIAQTTNNLRGCAGLAPGSTILPVKVLDKAGRGSNYSIGVGIRYAVDKGARVLNLSIGGVGSQTLKDAIEYARQKGAVICAAAGNSGKRGITYPAAYPQTISVGATTARGARASFSQYGPGLTLTAPGSQILQQTFGQSNQQSGYFYFSGTSMATPHVSGAATAILSINPNLSMEQVRALLTSTARDLGAPGWDESFGAGLLNAAGACQQAKQGAPPGLPTPPTPPAPGPLPTPVPPPVTPPVIDPGTETIAAEVLSLFNAARVQAGLTAVVIHPQLTAAAIAHAADMRKRQMMSHTGGDGSNPGARLTRAGYPWRTYGEIVAMGYPTPAAVTQAWMNSPGHKAIILGSQYREVGIAQDGAYWCAVWAAR